MLSIILIVILLTSITSYVSCDNLIDHNPNCEFWANENECDNNPQYMLANCALSCSKVTEAKDLQYESFYDIKETDLKGNKVDFENFRGKVVYIVNVASHCGYTAENYELFRKLQKYTTNGLEIVIAPCNQFGYQEPGDELAISLFASKQEFDGIILSKGNVNGPSTRASFQFLKAISGKTKISWNFDGKFLVDRKGNVHIPGENIEEEIVELLNQTEL